MRYFEGDSDFTSREVTNPIDLVKFIFLSFFISPFRLILEVSRKILFLGIGIHKYLINCLVINLGMILISVVNSLFITKRFYLKGGLLPLSSLLVSFLILVGLYFLSYKFFVNVDFEIDIEDVEDEILKVSEMYGVDESSILEKTKESEEIIDDEEIDIFDDSNIEEVFNTILEESKPKPTEEHSTELAELLRNYRKDVEISSPEVSSKGLYSSEIKLEGECVEVIKNNAEMSSVIDREKMLAAINNPRKFDVIPDSKVTETAKLELESVEDFSRSAATVYEYYGGNAEELLNTIANNEKEVKAVDYHNNMNILANTSYDENSDFGNFDEFDFE